MLYNNKEVEDFEFKDELLFYQSLLSIHQKLARIKILQVRHDLTTARYVQINKTIELIYQDY